MMRLAYKLANKFTSKVRERDFMGSRVPEEMSAAQVRLEELSDRRVREALSCLGADEW